jgi:hypothetical protein
MCGALRGCGRAHSRFQGACPRDCRQPLFPATLTIDDPGVNDELAIPTISMFKTGDDPSVKQRDISAEFAKRITEDFAVSLMPTWTKIYAPGGPNLTGAKFFRRLLLETE